MSKTETVADALAWAAMKIRDKFGPDAEMAAQIIESALAAKAEAVEPVAWLHKDSVSRPLTISEALSWRKTVDFTIPLYAHAQPAAKVEAPPAESVKVMPNIRCSHLGCIAKANGGTVCDPFCCKLSHGDAAAAQRASAIFNKLENIQKPAPPPASVPDGCHVVRYNDDGEFGQKVGWLYRTGGDPCVISGKPVYVWRPIAELLETTA